MFKPILGVLIVLVVIARFITWTDKRWYKRHPGAEKKFGQIDEDLKRQGR